jgi:hypothetical protein
MLKTTWQGNHIQYIISETLYVKRVSRYQTGCMSIVVRYIWARHIRKVMLHTNTFAIEE